MSIQSPPATNMYTTGVIKKLSLPYIDENVLAYWSNFMKRHVEYEVHIKNRSFTIVPYYGLVYNSYDNIGVPYFLDLDFGGSEPVTLSIPRSLLTLLLSDYLDPLLPEHFDDAFVCQILEMLLVDTLRNIKDTSGLIIRFLPFSGAKGIYKSQWRIYLQGSHDLMYPVLIVGQQWDINDFVEKLFLKSAPKRTYLPKLEIKIVSFIRNISVKKLKNLKPGEIIILLSKRHLVNEPLVFIGDKIVVRTKVNQMQLEVIKSPSLMQDDEELGIILMNSDNDIPTNYNDESADNNQDYDNNDYHQDSQDFQNQEGYLPKATDAVSAALHDYKVTVIFELNRLEIPVNIVSQLTAGSVINLQKEITEDVYLTVSGRTIAIGEVVQVGRNFGVLIKEVLNG